MSILIYLLGYIIAFICFRKSQKKDGYPHDWKEVLKAVLFAILSWIIVLLFFMNFIYFLSKKADNWYEDNKDKFGKPPKWL